MEQAKEKRKEKEMWAENVSSSTPILVAASFTKDGKAMIQAITIRDDQYFDYRRTVDFIQKYIFPGGMLICPTKINELSLAADLEVTNDYMMGESYAKTLDLWRESFLENWKKISDLGFDERFKRMWN